MARRNKFNKDQEELIAATAREKGAEWTARAWGCSRRLVYVILERRKPPADELAEGETRRHAGRTGKSTAEGAA